MGIQYIYVVYVTYFNEVERVFAFTNLEQAEAKQLELCNEWVNKDQFAQFAKYTNLDKEPTLEHYLDYFLEYEDDAYVSIKQTELVTSETNRIQQILEEDILERYCNSEYLEYDILSDFIATDHKTLTQDELNTIEWIFGKSHYPVLNQ